MGPTQPGNPDRAARLRGDSAFGRALREWRTRRGLSQLALAVDAGVSSRHLSFVESFFPADQATEDAVRRLASG